MKTAKEFLEKVQSDQKFADEVKAAIDAKKNAGAKDYTEALIPVAKELGYEITKEQVEAFIEQQKEAISEEELGKVAGGTSCWWAAVAVNVIAYC